MKKKKVILVNHKFMIYGKSFTSMELNGDALIYIINVCEICN